MVASKISSLFKSKGLKQGVVVLVDQGMMSLLTFITGVLIARSSSEEEYALYMLGWSIVLFMKGFHEAIVNLPFTVYVPRLSDADLRIYQGNALIHTAVFCLLLGLFVLLAGIINELYVFKSNLELVELAPLLFFLLMSFVFRDFLRNALLAQLEVWKSVRINASLSLLLIVTISAFYYFDYLTLVNAYMLFVLSFGTAASVMFWQHRSQYEFDMTILWSQLLKNWQLAKWALVGNFAYLGSRMSYPWLILYFLDYKSVAAYYACMALAMVPAPILRGAAAYIFPRMSHGYKEGSVKSLVRLLRKSILLLSFPYLLWLIVGVTFNKELIEMLYVEKFSGYGLLFTLLMISTTIDFIFSPLTNALQVLEKTRAITTSLVIGAILTLVLGPILIISYGLTGAAVSVIVSTSGTMAWRIYVILTNCKNDGINLKS